ncbi:MAG: septal ring lytic transglycosylase RlpA family protein [Myxococcales bacterium]|nr:septal ring lytic transglycosylase RlpA family protein [Myxococcales bacterium]
MDVLVRPRRWAAFRACPPMLLAAALLSCGGAPFMRTQGAYISPEGDPDAGDFKGAKPVVVLEGEASYYADSLAGNHTANGERYDPRRRTAASRDLPFGSIVRVIRRDTGQHTLVRINDRGPFRRRKRILDLSRAAASDLDMLDRGVIQVRAEVLKLGPKKKKRSKKRSKPKKRR